MKKTLAVALAALLLVSLLLTACGGGGASPVGTWTVSAITVDGQTYKQGDMAFDLVFGSEDMLKFEFKEGGAFSVVMFGEAMDGTWTQSGSTVTATVEGDPLDMTFTGNELKAEMDGTGIILTRK